MSNIAIITARGGSKRIPRKNIREFCGKPIIAYSIEAAKGAGIFDEVMVSTDDQEIADISIKYGASVPFLRSPENSGDYSGTADVLLEVLREYQKSDQYFDVMCCLYPTAPFVTIEKLCSAYKIFTDHNAEKVMSVTAFSYPPQRSLLKDSTGKLYYQFPEHYKSRSQDLEKWYHDAGQFYFFDVNAFMSSDGLVQKKVYSIIISETEVQDIDNEEDWMLAEMKYKLMMNKLND